jgi:hypothetical protein
MAGVGAALEVLEIFDSFDYSKIENRLAVLGQELKSLGVIKDYYSIGLLFYITLNRNYAPDALYSAGINGNFNESNGIFICAPAVADNEYFTELSQRLRSFL